MSEQEYAKIIGANLRRVMGEHGKTQADLVRDLKISKTTLSSWMNGKRTPRMPKIDLLCHYFNCSRAELMEVSAPKRQTVKISATEIDIIRKYRTLNADGRAKLHERLDELLEMPRYTEKGEKYYSSSAEVV